MSYVTSSYLIGDIMVAAKRSYSYKMIVSKYMRRPVSLVTEDGKTVVLVSLNKDADKLAAIYEDDYDLIVGLGASPTWCLMGRGRSKSVFTNGKKASKLGVARLILDAGAGARVKYLDGDVYNLRRENLTLEKHGRAFRRDRDYI